MAGTRKRITTKTRYERVVPGMDKKPTNAVIKIAEKGQFPQFETMVMEKNRL